MTVCIAALCSAENGVSKNVIVASDRMVTLGGFMEFEHQISKISKLTDKSVILVAGDTYRGSKVVDVVKDRLAEIPDNKIQNIANWVTKVYSECRDELIETEIFKTRGFTKKEFYENYQTKLLPQLAFQLDQQVITYDFGVQLIVAGVDELGSHAFAIYNPGNSIDIHQIGYVAIGSGTLHATQSLIGFGHSPAIDLKTTVFCTFASKKRAEVAPGVGKDTDLFIITEQGIKALSQDEIKQLDEIYEQDYHKPLTDNVIGKINELPFI